MQKLNLPEYKIKVRKTDTTFEIFDRFRKKYVVLTPEEWVRQNFLLYLVFEKNVPETLIVVEKSLTVNNLQKRCDIVIYDKSTKPKIIVECKAANVKITQDTFDQIIRYNMTLKVDYLIVTNGLTHYCCFMDYKNDQYSFLQKIPEFHQL